MPVLVTLLSDFGSHSPYPAAMKAVVAALCDPLFVDITHDVPRHDVRGGAYRLWAVVPWTPTGSVHLAVVDPGVGTPRRPLIVTAGGQSFVGPDNGLLIPAARRLGEVRAYVITDGVPGGRPRSATFHGRDVFAPVAGHLARGTSPDVLGVPADTVTELEFGLGRAQDGALVGRVIYIDPFGNVITNLPSDLLPPSGVPVAVRAGRRRGRAVVGRTYADVRRGQLVVFPGSDGFVEIASREASAARLLGAVAGGGVRIAISRRAARPPARSVALRRR